MNLLHTSVLYLSYSSIIAVAFFFCGWYNNFIILNDIFYKDMFLEINVQYIEAFIFIMPFVTVFFILTAVIFVFKEYYKIQKALFWITIIPAMILVINICYIVTIFYRGDGHLFYGEYMVNIFIRSMYFLFFLISIIYAYWIHACSSHKYRDYWILAIPIGILILGLLWLN